MNGGSPNMDKPLPSRRPTSSPNSQPKLFERSSQLDEENPWATSTPASARAIYVGPPQDLLTLGSGPPPKLPQRPPSHARNSSASTSTSTPSWLDSTTSALFGSTPTSSAPATERPPPQLQTQMQTGSPGSGTVVPKANNPFSNTTHTPTSISGTNSNLNANANQNPFAPPIPNRPPPPLPSSSSTFSSATPPPPITTTVTSPSSNFITSPASTTPDYFGASSSSNAPLQFNFDFGSSTSIAGPSSSSPFSSPSPKPTPSPRSNTNTPSSLQNQLQQEDPFSSPSPATAFRGMRKESLLAVNQGIKTSGGGASMNSLNSTTSNSTVKEKSDVGFAGMGRGMGMGGGEAESKLRMDVTRLVEGAMRDLVGAQEQVVNLFEAWRIQDSVRSPSTNGSPKPSSTTTEHIGSSTTTRPVSPDHETATFLANFPELPSESETNATINDTEPTESQMKRSIPNLAFHTQRSQNTLINTLTTFILQNQSQPQPPPPTQPSSELITALEERTKLLARAEKAEKELEKKEFEMRREGERIDRERIISGEKLINMKTEIEKLRGQAKKNEEEHSENLENATTHAGFLQERINVLEQALNDMDGEMAGNRTRNDRNREAEEDGDNIWREIVDQQSDLLGDHTKALATLSTSLTCGICSELMNGPTTLLCGHSGCLTCFQAWFARGNNNCPECRKEGVNGGGMGLATAYALMDVVTELKKIGLGEGED